MLSNACASLAKNVLEEGLTKKFSLERPFFFGVLCAREARVLLKNVPSPGAFFARGEG
jgi:hypothetical protein